MKERGVISMRAVGPKLLSMCLGLIMIVYGQGLTVSGAGSSSSD